ncbi:alpha/beta fold hydrolase [Fodinibacter luteus]|uniref:Proline iminopeptidase n=2 Tax=Fodinibacter luteus TaxID=552064 RepID=A0ABP8KFY4_9MICO
MAALVGPDADGMLEVDGGAAVYWEQCGPSDGVPAVYLHGGPGGGLGTSQYRTRFDLSRTRVVGIDQRGCGRSVPHASDPQVSLSDNTTTQLIADLERVREHLSIDAWILNGASWGSTLALAYAQENPHRVLGIVLYAVTTTSRCEVDWVTEGMRAVFPEAWDRLASHAEAAGLGYRRGHGRLVQAYAHLMNSPDLAVREAASQEWALWEDTHISIGVGQFKRDTRWDDPRFRHAFVRLTTHYWSHDGFCDPPILEQMHRLEGIPGMLIHGRRDISSPAATPWELHRRWHGSTLRIDEGDGHGGTSMARSWRIANDALTSRIQH